MSFVAPAAGLFNFTPAHWLNNKTHILDHPFFFFYNKTFCSLFWSANLESVSHFWHPGTSSSATQLSWSCFDGRGFSFDRNTLLDESYFARDWQKTEVEEVPGVQVIMGYFPQCMWSWDISKHLIWTHLRPLCSVHRDVIRQTFAHTHPQRLLTRWW